MISLSLMTAHAKDKYGHVLTDMWKTYESALEKDKPKEQMAALDNIKKEAKKQKLAWDFYDASFKYASAASSRNWKEAEEQQKKRDKDIEAFPLPVTSVHLWASNGSKSDEEIFKYIQDNKSKLLEGHNDEFYKRADFFGHPYTDIVIGNLANDYEYALFRLIMDKSWNTEEKSVVKDECLSYFKDNYPLGAVAEYASYVEHQKGEAKQKAAGDFLAKYNGKAVALLATQDLLYTRFNELQEKKDATSTQYSALDRDCVNFMSGKAKFSGSEKEIADCCICPEDIHEKLNSKSAGFNIENGKLSVDLRNLDKVRVTITGIDGKKKVYDETLENKTKSFFVMDTIEKDLPAYDDGAYDVVLKASGIDNLEGRYEKHSLSVSVRKDKDGYALFAADQLSGEPAEAVSVSVCETGNNKLIAECKYLKINGFTRLPENITAELMKGRHYVEASYTDKDGLLHSSGEQYVSTWYFSNDPNEDRFNCIILTDRSAFTPDETVHFKAVLYHGYYKLGASAGEELVAVLQDAEGNELDSRRLVTNEFGSVAGDFVLKRSKKNGSYSIIIKHKGSTVGRKSVTVDDFVLPTFALTWAKDKQQYHPGDMVKISGNIVSYSGHSISSADINYTVNKYGETFADGKLTPDAMGNFTIEFKSDPESDWASYSIQVKAVDATGETLEFSRYVNIRVESKDDEKQAEYIFEKVKDEPENVGVRIVSGKKITWAIVEVFGTDYDLLARKLVKFGPENGQPAETTVKFKYEESWPEAVRIYAFYFQNSDEFEHSHQVRRPDDSWKIPVSFSRFLDTTLPGATYTFTVKTEAGTECAATIYDKSTETVHSNLWNPVQPNRKDASYIDYLSYSGSDELYHRYYGSIYVNLYGASKYYNEDYSYPVYETTRAVRKMAAGANMVSLESADNGMLYDTVVAYSNASSEDIIEEEAIEIPMAEDVPEQGYIRENFANTIAWEPFLKADDDGNINFRFTNADKLSTYYVQMFVHDPEMRNFSIRKEFKVTLPVKIALVEPQVLYDGDRYVMKATLSNSTGSPVSGKLLAEFLSGGDNKSATALTARNSIIEVPAHGQVSSEFEINVQDIETLGIRLTFTADNKESGSDGVFVSVPVHKAVQTITEAHSGILMSGEDEMALISRLRSEFVNVSGEDASVREVSIRNILKEAVPEMIEPESDNVIALTEALFARYLLDELKNGSANVDPESEILQKILKCKKADGGFGWFEEFESSPIVTVVVMQRFALMGIKDLCSESAKYLDDIYFVKKEMPYWRGWISMQQYVYVRSLYSEVDFSTKGFDSDRWKAFKKSLKKYLVTKKTVGLNGQLLAKSRRVRTIQALIGSEDGIRLAKDWGVKLGTASKLAKTLTKDVESLVEYAVPHKDGGYYFPNAVMPFRGLIESEAYAHSMFCDLMDEMGYKDIADGVRLWLMLQKETQVWGDEPAYIEALNSVFHGSGELLATKVIALKASTEKPFEEIKAAGNGFAVERSYWRDGKHLSDGDELHVGDRIQAKYSVYSDENRSFVRLSAPRCAAFKPVNQLSGYSNGGYRSVLADRTEFWYETYPEEKTVRTEDFYVSQAGTFQSPVVEIECLYADHYRANDCGRPAVTCK